MIVKSKARGRMFDGNSSVLSKMLETESIMTDVFTTIISRYQTSIDKRREAPKYSGGFWDYNPDDVDVNKSLERRTESQLDSKTNNIETIMQNQKTSDQNLSKGEPSILEELFPDLGSFDQFSQSKNVQPFIKPSSGLHNIKPQYPLQSKPYSKDAGSSYKFTYDILSPKKKIPIQSTDSLKEESGICYQSKAKVICDTTPRILNSSPHTQYISREVCTASLASDNPKALNFDIDKQENIQVHGITPQWSARVNPLPNVAKLEKESSMNNYSKDYFHPKNGENEPKNKSSPKSTVNGKTFEQGANEQILNKSFPPKDQQLQLDQIHHLGSKIQSINQLENQQRLPTLTNATSPSLKSNIEKLEVEVDYFYGVQSDCEMDCSFKDEYLRGDAESKEMLEISKESIQPVAEGGMKDLLSKKFSHVAKSYCQVSEFLEKFATDDAIGPSLNESEILLEQNEELERYGAKRKSTAACLPQKAKLNSRRNRHNSKLSPHSCNYSRYSKDSLETSDVMVSLQVTDDKGNMVEDLVVLGMKIFEIKEGFPKIFNVIPAVDMEDITLPYNARAMAVVLRCVLQASYTLPNWDVAVEVYAIAKEYRIQKLVESCKVYFNHNPIATDDVLRIAQLVSHFEIAEVLKCAKTFQTERSVFQHPGAYKTKSCTISIVAHKEPSEFSVPLFYSKGDLGSIRKSDFRNELKIESKCGVHAITGVQIKFELDFAAKGKEIVIFCEVEKGNVRVLDVEKKSQLQTRIDLKFKEEIHLRPKESISLIILIDDIKCGWCYCLKDEKSEYETKSGMLSVVFKSHNKTSEKWSLFFIDKVFYTN